MGNTYTVLTFDANKPLEKGVLTCKGRIVSYLQEKRINGNAWFVTNTGEKILAVVNGIAVASASLPPSIKCRLFKELSAEQTIQGMYEMSDTLSDKFHYNGIKLTEGVDFHFTSEDGISDVVAVDPSELKTTLNSTRWHLQSR